MIKFAPETPPSGRYGLDERQKTTYEAYKPGWDRVTDWMWLGSYERAVKEKILYYVHQEVSLCHIP